MFFTFDKNVWSHSFDEPVKAFGITKGLYDTLLPKIFY